MIFKKLGVYYYALSYVDNTDPIMADAKKKRKDRRIKLKRVFNYDAEMKFVRSFWELKKKDMSLEEFATLAKKTLVETDQLSEEILNYFLEQERMKMKISELETTKKELEEKLSGVKSEIKELKDILKEDEEDSKPRSNSSPSSYDPCSHGTIRNGC